MSEHELWNELGNLYFLSGEYQQAVHAYRRSIQLEKGFGRPYSNLALTYVQQGRYEDAIDLYRRSIELLGEDHEKAISWNRLGNVLRHLKDYQQAVVAYRHADELDPENGETAEEPGWASNGHDTRVKRVQAVDKPIASEEPFPYALPQGEALEPEEPAADPTATWAPIDPTLFQQDTFEALDPGTLTTWGEPGIEPDDPDDTWQTEAGTEVYVPDGEADALSTWLPAPDDQPADTLEYSLEAVDLAAELDEAQEEPAPAEAIELFADLEPEPPDPVASSMQTTESAGVMGSPAESRRNPGATAREEMASTAVDLSVAERPSSGIVTQEDDRQTGAGPTLENPVEVQAPAEAEARIDIIVMEPTQAEATAAPHVAPVEATASDMVEAMSFFTEPEVIAPMVEEATITVAPVERVPLEPQRDPEELREIQSGLAKYRRVVQLNPKNARAWDTLGNLYKSAGEYQEALGAYQQAITHDPTKALFHHHLGLVYACMGQVDDAIDAFQRVIALDPQHGLAHAALGGYYRKKGLEELAQKHVGIAMKSIFDSENEYNRACLAAICGNTDQALELLRVALKNKQTYVDWILRDPDLDFIRQDPRFKQLISDYAR